jgi:hypothetical protein
MEPNRGATPSRRLSQKRRRCARLQTVATRYAKPDVGWFEVDHPDIQADKRTRLERLGIDATAIGFRDSHALATLGGELVILDWAGAGWGPRPWSLQKDERLSLRRHGGTTPTGHPPRSAIK